MAISADVADPMDEKHGGTAAWGRFLQSKDEEAILYVKVPEGTRGRAVNVVFKSAALKVMVQGQVCMDAALSHPVHRARREQYSVACGICLALRGA